MSRLSVSRPPAPRPARPVAAVLAVLGALAAGVVTGRLYKGATSSSSGSTGTTPSPSPRPLTTGYEADLTTSVGGAG